MVRKYYYNKYKENYKVTKPEYKLYSDYKFNPKPSNPKTNTTKSINIFENSEGVTGSGVFEYVSYDKNQGFKDIKPAYNKRIVAPNAPYNFTETKLSKLDIGKTFIRWGNATSVKMIEIVEVYENSFTYLEFDYLTCELLEHTYEQGRYSRGALLEENIIAEDGVYPDNGRKGGFWWVKGSLIEDDIEEEEPPTEGGGEGEDNVSTLRKLGPGPTKLIKGNNMAGYYGKTSLPNISKKAFADMLGVTEGVFTNGLTDTDSGNTDGSEKIEWLKFSHNYKTLFIADRNIKRAISWDHLENKGVVNGLKEIEIDGVKYRVRLMVGAETNPAQNTNNTQPKGTTEWNDLIVDLVPNTSDSNWKVIDSWCQEGSSINYSFRVLRGYHSVVYFKANVSNSTISHYGWRPVLEVL